MQSPFRISLAQINTAAGDIDGNAGRMRRVLGGMPGGNGLAVFPELALCGYPAEDMILNAAFLDRADGAVARLAAESAGHGFHLLLGAPLRRDGRIYNAVHLIGGGAVLETRLKHRLPTYGVFDERRVFESGPLPDPVPFRGHRLGVVICEDLWHRDAAAHLKTQGAEILIAVNASPYDMEKHERRTAAARARVQETGLPLVYVNQCGGQDDLVFDGASFVMNEAGRLVVQAEEFAEDVHHTVWEKAGGHWLCGTDAVSPVHGRTEAVYQAAMTGLRDYVLKNGFPGVLVGLSGGIDSALTAALAADALGPQAVHCVMMPSRFTSQESLDDADAIARALNVRLDTIPIGAMTAAFEKELAPHFTKDTPPVTHENIQPRCRGIVLMALSNATGKMVLSTGNKSEIATGYATLYGDMCGGFNPLKDIYKTHVYELARFRNGKKPDHALGPRGPVIPENVLTRAPTAELRPGQTDQDTLPPYAVLDAILGCLVEEDMGVKETAARGFDPATVKRVARMLAAAEHKRRQSAPGPKISTRAFGRERRWPIAGGLANLIEKQGETG